MKMQLIGKSRIMRRDGESDDHWVHRIRVSGFYRYVCAVTGGRYWLGHWGKRPPVHEGDYVEPPDEGTKTNGASSRTVAGG